MRKTLREKCMKNMLFFFSSSFHSVRTLFENFTSSLHISKSWMGMEPRSPTLQANSLPSEPPREAQEHWSGLPFPSPGELLNPGIKLGSPALQADTLPAELPG